MSPPDDKKDFLAMEAGEATRTEAASPVANTEEARGKGTVTAVRGIKGRNNTQDEHSHRRFQENAAKIVGYQGGPQQHPAFLPYPPPGWVNPAFMPSPVGNTEEARGKGTATAVRGIKGRNNKQDEHSRSRFQENAAAIMGYQGGPQQHPAFLPYPPPGWVNPAFMPSPVGNTEEARGKGTATAVRGIKGRNNKQDEHPHRCFQENAAAIMGYQGGPQQHQAFLPYPPPGWVNPACMPYFWQQQHHGPEFGFPAGYQHPPPPPDSHDFREFVAWQQSRASAEQGHTGWKDLGGEVESLKEKEDKPATGRNRKKKHESETAKSLILLQTNDETPLDTFWADLVEDSEFVCAQLRGDIADSLFVAMGQFRPCGLTHDDRVGKYKNREIGFVGMCCKHCGGQPGFGRYFPGSYDSFLNGTNCTGVVKHIKSECRACPDRVRETVIELKKQEESAEKNLTANRPRYGSRKRFYTYVWSRLREIQLSATATEESEIGHPIAGNPDFSLDRIVAASDIVSIKDRHLVPDTTLVAMAQMKMCKVTEEDKIGRCKDRQIGFKGLCCKHCDGKAGKPGYGRYFPSSLRSLAQADSCQQITKHVTSKCAQCPPEIRSVIIEMQLLEKSERIRYGSRKIFFRRVWWRLHGESSEVAELGEDDEGDDKEQGEEDEDIPWERVLGDSEVVSLSDRGLISDSQLIAIAQMNLCKLTEVDRIGWFKNRAIGSGGLCCKHCGGRPGFGRYFPNSVRSFAQTTSSQTIISHVALYCEECPKDIRDIVLQLQRKENSNEGTATLANSLYGSRKVFFNKVWGRMHQKDETASAGTTGEGADSKPAVKGSIKKKAPKAKRHAEEKAVDEDKDMTSKKSFSFKRLKTDVEVVV